MKTSRISRVVRLLTTLQSGEGYAVGDLAKMFGTSRRTVFRDLKELQTVGVPYHYNPKNGGYAIDPEFFLPPIDLNLQEALGLCLLVHKMSGQVQLPFKNSVQLAALKIENNLPPKIRQYCNMTMQNISIRANPQAPSSELDKNFAELQKAIAGKMKVSMRYHSFFEGQIINIELCPYHLMHSRRAWYVLGFSDMHKSIRTFKLNRIRELNCTGRRFIDGQKFDSNDYFGRAWSMMPEGKIYNIKLRFLPMAANNVAEVQWHSTQKVTRNGDGSVIVEFRVDGLREITWWILGYGDQVEVLAPKLLRRKVLETAKNVIKLNS
ncbi:MAG: WYL domain-containing protein [Phycisphaerae bacterium]|jgi:proteasome accessory factor B